MSKKIADVVEAPEVTVQQLPEAPPEESAEVETDTAEKIAKSQAAWRTKNPEKVKGYQKKWRKANPAAVKTAHKTYQENNPRKVKLWHQRSTLKNRRLALVGSLIGANDELALQINAKIADVDSKLAEIAGELETLKQQ